MNWFLQLVPFVQILVILVFALVICGFFYLVYYLLKNFKDANIKTKHFEISGKKEDNLEYLLTQERLIANEINRIESIETISKQMNYTEEVIDKSLADHYRLIESCYESSNKSDEEKAEFRKNYSNFIEHLKKRCLEQIKDIYKEDDFKNIQSDVEFNEYAKNKTKNIISFLRNFISTMAPKTTLTEVENRRRKAINMSQYDIINVILEAKEIRREKQKQIQKYKLEIEKNHGSK